MSSNAEKVQSLMAKFQEDVSRLTEKLKTDLSTLGDNSDSENDESFWAIRPSDSSESDYHRFLKENFHDMEPHEGDEFAQAWGYKSSLKGCEKSLTDVYNSDNPLGELSNLYDKHAPMLIHKIYSVPIGSTFYSIHKNHLWKCKRIGEYYYDSSKAYSHRFKAKIINILDVEKEKFCLKNSRTTITTITFP